MNIPTLNSSAFKQREREVGKEVEIVAKTSCQESLNKERSQALCSGSQSDENNLISVHCSFDMG